MNKIITFLRESQVARFFIPAGIVLIVFGIFSFVFVNRTKNYPKVEAIVSKVELYEEEYTDGDTVYEATYNVSVKYTIDGVDYEEEYGVFSGYKEGDKVTIAYNPKNPKEIVQPTSMMYPIFIIGFGIASLIFGIFSATKAIKNHKAMKKQEEAWSNGK